MKKIVLIEDNKDVRESTQEILQLADYNVLTAENGKLGVELVKREKPDLIMCDIMMPNLDGYGVLRILNKNPETSKIPFIFVTAKSDKTDVRKGMNLGADDYISKPYEENELLEAIETRLARSARFRVSDKPDEDELTEFLNTAEQISKLTDLSHDRKTKVYGKKETIYREDDYANYIYHVKSGKVKCIKSDSYGKDYVHELYGTGDFFGCTSMFDEGDYNETAIAMEETEVSIIPKSDFQSLLNSNRDVAANFIKMLAGSIKEREKQLLQLAYAPIRERLADVLLKLSKNYEKNDEGIIISISREDLAGMVGTAKESLIRTLSELKKESLVRTDGQDIVLIDLLGLKKVASGF